MEWPVGTGIAAFSAWEGHGRPFCGALSGRARSANDVALSGARLLNIPNKRMFMTLLTEEATSAEACVQIVRTPPPAADPTRQRIWSGFDLTARLAKVLVVMSPIVGK